MHAWGRDAPTFRWHLKMFEELHTPHPKLNPAKQKMRSESGRQARARSAVDEGVRTRGVRA